MKEDGTSLSPLEKYICAYANSVYKGENTESENYLKSRNLVSMYLNLVDFFEKLGII